MKPATFRHAVIVSPETGRLIGGEVIEDHGNGDVTLLFAGALKRRGPVLTAAEIRAFETKQRGLRLGAK